jgi:DNA primase
VFCFDGDRAGRAAAWKALESALPRLRDGRQAYFLFLPEGEDPDSLIRKEGKNGFEKRLQEATTPLSDYFFQFLGAASDLQTADGRARLKERCKEFIKLIPDGAFRDQMISLLQERTVAIPEFLQRAPESIREAALDIFNEKLAEVRREMGIREDEAFLPIPSSSHPIAAPTYKRTLVRSAIALLLAHPNLAEQVERPYRFLLLDKPGITLLAELLDLARSRPGITTGALLEHFTDRSDYEALKKLAVTPMVGEPETQHAEFFDALIRMENQAMDLRREILMAKRYEGTLSSAEKAELRELLAARNPLPKGAP